MSILLGDCSENIKNHYVDCNIKKMVIKDIGDGLNSLGIDVKTIRHPTSKMCNEIIWIRDIYVPIDNIYIRCNLTKNCKMNTDRSWEFDGIAAYLDKEKQILQIPTNVYCEGGDFIQYMNYIFVGIGNRTNIEIVNILKPVFPDKTFIPIRHSALHLDCCLCVLDDVVFYDRKYIENIELPPFFKSHDISSIVDSGKYLATNFIQIGDSIITTNQRQNAAFRKMLRDMGYKLIMINIRDLWKEGGSIRCLTQCL